MQPVAQTSDRAIGDRVAARRTTLGYTRDTVATRAGMSLGYIEYVEDEGGRPSAGVLRRLADALHTTVEYLYGEAALEPELSLSRSHGFDRAAAQKPVVARLLPDECRVLMGSVLVGRVAFVVNGPPVVFPVNFTMLGLEIAIRTAAMSPLAELARAGRSVSFEVDDIDEPSRLGWSVLCHGPTRLAHEQDDPDQDVLDLVRPWIGGDRHTVVMIAPTTITGRRIGLA